MTTAEFKPLIFGLVLATGFPHIDSARTAEENFASDVLLRRNIYRAVS
jgi:hypothetical protein